MNPAHINIQVMDAWLLAAANDHYAGDEVRFNTYSGWYRR